LDALLETVREKYPDILERAIEAMPLPDELDHEMYLTDNLIGLEDISDAYGARNWETYVQLHRDAYKPYALLYARYEWGFCDAEYWETLRTIWMMAQTVGSTPVTWLELFEPCDGIGVRCVFTADELSVFDSLPDTVTAYRGAQEPAKRGMSWSLDIKMAEFFAKRTHGSVWRVEVPRSAVLAYFADRAEAELVIQVPESVKVTPV
jgi:hypothetical protein